MFFWTYRGGAQCQEIDEYFLSFLACPQFDRRVELDGTAARRGEVHGCTESRKNERRANQPALRVPGSAHPKQAAALPLFPVLAICPGRLLTGVQNLFRTPEHPYAAKEFL